MAPTKTPPAVLQTLHDAIVDVANDRQVAAKIRVQDITPASIGLKDFEAYIRGDMQRLSPLLAEMAGPKGDATQYWRATRETAFNIILLSSNCLGGVSGRGPKANLNAPPPLSASAGRLHRPASKLAGLAGFGFSMF